MGCWRSTVARRENYSENDITFLQGAANILGMAIERQRYERQLKTALDRHQILLKEITRRFKNSLQVVISMLHLQASASNDATLGAQLAEASSRLLSYRPCLRAVSL